MLAAMKVSAAGLILFVLGQGADQRCHEDGPGPQAEAMLPNPSEAKKL